MEQHATPFDQRPQKLTLNQLKEREAIERSAAREHFTKNPKWAVVKLYDTALHRTGGGRAASGFLLSLWNNNFAANMRDVISSLDIENTEAVLALMNTLGPGHHLERYLTDEQIGQIIEVWGDQHEKRRA